MVVVIWIGIHFQIKIPECRCLLVSTHQVQWVIDLQLMELMEI